MTRILPIDTLAALPAGQWNALNLGGDPFLRHEFLAALERHGAAGPQYGWRPAHLAAFDETGLRGAVPAYIKTNSYGEFVFDFAWAEAHERLGLAYYPKFVIGVPYTPATGPRLLLADRNDRATAHALVEATIERAHAHRLSSVHWLFPDAHDQDFLREAGWLMRKGCQFHWANRGYRDFEDYLATLRADRRKKMRQERRRALESGCNLVVRHGPEIGAELWDHFHRFYAATFRRRGGAATLSRDFFGDVARTLGNRLLVISAERAGRPVGAAIFYRSDDCLYGRHWGCDEHHPGLHFEVCYHQGIEYCIKHGLARFEPGAQGEHKVWRGFAPASTWSAHWIAHPGMRRAIARHLALEEEAMADYADDISAHLPFKAITP
jgi:hypothetical protein